MRIDFVEVTPKRKNIKNIITVILVILFIALSAVLGIYYARVYNFNIIAKIKENNKKYEASNEATNIIKDEEQEGLFPKYTEEAKNKMKNIYNSETKIAYLTFDDGPSQTVTPLILDVLKQQNVKATFFVIGSNVKNNPEIVKRAYLEGHYIANHGYSHSYKKIYISANSVLEEYKKTEKAIQKAIENNKYSSHLFRFPGGHSGGSYQSIKKQAGELLNKNNISYIDWNALTGDAGGASNKEQIVSNIKKSTKNKGNIVVLMHDSSSKILTYETLNDVINYLKAEGYTFENFYNIMK